jgi:hypothetical protein
MDVKFSTFQVALFDNMSSVIGRQVSPKCPSFFPPPGKLVPPASMGSLDKSPALYKSAPFLKNRDTEDGK